MRNALGVLPNPVFGKVFNFQNHDHQPGARPYPGHTGSPVAFPAKALKAGDHGVPGGENTLVLLDGYVLHGSWLEAKRQLGDAVPVWLAQAVATSIAAALTPAPTGAKYSR